MKKFPLPVRARARLGTFLDTNATDITFRNLIFELLVSFLSERPRVFFVLFLIAIAEKEILSFEVSGMPYNVSSHSIHSLSEVQIQYNALP
jgi:hypothetical protein